MPPLTELYSNVGIAADPPLAAGISTSDLTITFSSTTVVSQFPTAVAGTSQFRALIYEDTNADGVADKAELVLVTAGGAGSTSWTIQRAYEAIGGQQSTFAFTTAARVAPILSSGGLGNLPGVSGDFALTSNRHLVMPGAYYPTAASGGTGSEWTIFSSGVTDPTMQATNEGLRPAVLRFAFTEDANDDYAGIMMDHVYRWSYIASYPVTNTGSGYGTTPPVVTVTAPESGGVQAYATSLLSGGGVVGILGASGSSATAAVDTNGVITALSALVGGSQYPLSATNIPVVLLQQYNRSARATVNTNSSGVATSVTLVSGGRGYTAGSVTIDTNGLYEKAPTASIAAPGAGVTATTNVAMNIEIRTGLHIKTYVQPERGAESSGLLVNSTGGSNAITAYRFVHARPTGWRNWADSVQPVMEIGSNTGSISGFFSAGSAYAYHTETATTTDNPLTYGAATINVNATTGFQISTISAKGYGCVEVSSAAVAWFSYTGMTGTSFTGVVWVKGSGTYATGSTIRQQWSTLGVMARIETPLCKGFLATPGDGYFGKASAFAVAGHAHNNHIQGAATWEVLLDGSQTGLNARLVGSGQATPYHGRSTDFGGLLSLNDVVGGVGDGGMIQFEAGSVPFTAIKAHLTDGTGYGQLKIGIRDASAGLWNYHDSVIIAGQAGRTGGYMGLHVAPSALLHLGGTLSSGSPAMAIATNVTDAIGIQLTPQLSLSAGNFSIISAQARIAPTAALATNVYGFLSIPTIGPSSGAANSNTFSMVRMVNIYSATATATAYGGTIAEAIDYHAGGMALGTSSTATVTRQIGFYCGLLPTKNTAGTGGPAEQSWAVYAEGRAATPAAGDRGNPSYFGDFIRAWDIEQYGTFVRYGIQVNRNAASVVAIGTALTASLLGTASFVSTASGGVLNLATTAVINNIASAALSSFSQTQFQWGPVFTINLQPVDITAVRIWAGLFQSAMTNADTPAAGNCCAAFRFSTVASDTTWRAVTANATTATVATSVNSVTVAANTRYLLRVDCSDTVNARFYVNGLLVASTNTTIPPASTFLGMHLAIITQAATIKNIRFGGMWIAEE